VEKEVDHKEDKMEERLKETISGTLGLVKEVIKLDSSLVEELKIDELDRVELTFALEEEFNIQIPDEESEGWTTVGDIFKTIQEKSK
jgi:acyl carrier protein